MSFLEWVQNIQQQPWTEEQVNARLRDYLHTAYGAVSEEAKQTDGDLRAAAYRLAIARVAEATALRS